MTNAYGAAGSIIVVLLWVYYSAIILYFGAVFTRVYAIHMGSAIYPNKYAVWVQQVEVESKNPFNNSRKLKRFLNQKLINLNSFSVILLSYWSSV